MKINRTSLLEAVKVAGKISETVKSSMPILSAVVLDGEKQALIATDLEMGLVYPLEIADYTYATQPEKFPDECRIENELPDLTGPQLKNLADDYGIKVPSKAKVEKLRETILQVCQKAEEELSVEAILGLNAASTWQDKFCLPCRGLRKILETLDEETVEIRPVSADETMLFRSNPGVAIGENFSNLLTMDVSEFPEFWDRETLDYPGSVLVSRKDLDSVALAGTNDQDHGFKLNAIYFDFKQSAVVATDGHRLHLCNVAPENATAPEGVDGFSMPLSALRVIATVFKRDENVLVEHGGDNIRIAFGNAKLYARTIEAKFPDWKAVVPNSENQKSVTLEKAAFEKPLHQAMTISDGKYSGITLKFNGGIDMGMANPERGQYQKISIPIKGKSYGDDETTIGLSIRYMLEAIKPVATDDMEIRFEDASRPVTINHENFTALVMPMRV